MTCNSVLVEKSNELRLRSMDLRSGSITDTITLDSAGFLDDFSYAGPYPDTSKWLNNYVFINNTMPISPPTIGVATFDGVNANGYPYNFSASQFSTGKADTLTSKPINLYYPGDTTFYFSFYYQPQGRGNFPDTPDSLILEFKTPITGAWHHVWATKGLSSATSDSTWKRVMIRVKDAAYLQKGFQFRFCNWATLSGNGDHWHVDYVYLNNNRVATDTIISDLAFVYAAPSLLKTYYAMPWKQYDTTYMKKQYTEVINNNFPAGSNGNFRYNIYDANHLQVNTTYGPYSQNFPEGYMTDPLFATPALNYTIPGALTGKTEYTIENIITGQNNRVRANDTIRHKQVFDNYFAYDDGTAEYSYGLAGSLHAQVAEKFKVNVADTLRCIDIYFNPQWTDASVYTFKLKVWAASGSGGPSGTIYTNPSLDTPQYNQAGRDQFTRYCLDAPVYLTAGTYFFIGFDQNTTQPINIGMDANNSNQDALYYNVSGTWLHTPDRSALMMRPILGSAAGVVGVEENPKAAKEHFSVYPNPANDKLFILSDLPAETDLYYTVIDLFGRTLAQKKMNASDPVDLSSFSNGVYFIRLSTDKTISNHKFIISR